MLQFIIHEAHASKKPGRMGFPWEFRPSDQALAEMRAVPKKTRNEVIEERGDWQVYSPVLGALPGAPVSKTNPPAALNGLCVDYDLPFAGDQLSASLAKQSPEGRKPAFIEISLSGNFRLVWVFEKTVRVRDAAHAAATMKELAKVLQVERLSAGFDGSCLQPIQRFVNGGDWFTDDGFGILPAAVTSAALFSASASHFGEQGEGEFDMKAVAAEVEKRFPGRWDGPFEPGAKGVRFWVGKADNPNGAMVTPGGMVCVTGGQSFVGWDEIFGADWVAAHREQRAAEILEDVYYDGRTYWFKDSRACWVQRSKEDQVLALQGAGVSNRIKKGETISQLGRALLQIHEQNRVDHVIPLVCRPSGILDYQGYRVLNTTRVTAMRPAENGDPSKWPWLRQFLDGLFARGSQRPQEHFMAWLKRAYVALLEHEPLMGQALFICGPKNNGKTLLNQRVIVPLLGDVQRDPYEYLTGRGNFNAELFEAYVWTLDDADSPRDGEKQSVLAKIKDAVVNVNHSYHMKYGAKTMVPWNGRLVSTLNDDSASVGLLPEVSANTRDKLCFFASQKFKGGWPSNREVETTLAGELPHFAKYLLEWEIPADIREPSRMGVKSFFDSEILRHSQQQHFAWNFQEILDLWVGSQQAEGQEPFKPMTVNPVSLKTMLASGVTESVSRDWTVGRIHAALRTLARNPNSGVVEHSGDARDYTIAPREKTS